MVSARLEGKALPAAPARPRRPRDQPGHGQRRGLVALLLWSQLLLLATVARRRGPPCGLQRRGLWIGAVPVLLAILWNVFENLAVLLPNTL